MAVSQGIDYSFARPGGAAIRAAGFSFVCRYLSHDQGKTLEAGELKDLRAAGLSIVLVWESYQNRSLTGWAGGVQDATDALNEANNLGVPSHVPIYFATDFDTTEAQDNTIDDYLKGAASVIGAGRVGLYGGYWIIKRCADEGTAKWLWQTVAWSGGNVDPRIHIYQNGNGTSLPGTDHDEARQNNYGQWSAGGSMSADAMTPDELTLLHELALFAPVGPAYIEAFTGQPFSAAADNLRADPPFNNPTRHALDEKLANYDNLKTQLDAANAKIGVLEGGQPLPHLSNNVPTPSTSGEKIPVTVKPPSKPTQQNAFVRFWRFLWS